MIAAEAATPLRTESAIMAERRAFIVVLLWIARLSKN
jgi:hypothetical protein